MHVMHMRVNVMARWLLHENCSGNASETAVAVRILHAGGTPRAAAQPAGII
jgi:hypothetical protein